MDDQLNFEFCDATTADLEKATQLIWDNLVKDMETPCLAPMVGLNEFLSHAEFTNDIGEPIFVEESGFFWEATYTQFMPPSGCSHEWKEYIGFTARYNYCEKCGEKS